MKMRYWTIGHRLPAALANPLFGDRCRFGVRISEDDPDWREWQTFYMTFYQNTQKHGFGKTVNDAGYEILRHVDLTSRNVLEIGREAFRIAVLEWKAGRYAVADINREFIDHSVRILRQDGLDAAAFVLSDHVLPLESESVDILISFYSLEHLHPLSDYLSEFCRVLRPKVSGGRDPRRRSGMGRREVPDNPAVHQETFRDQSRQNHLLGAPQLRRAHPAITGLPSGTGPSPFLAAKVAACGLQPDLQLCVPKRYRAQ